MLTFSDYTHAILLVIYWLVIYSIVFNIFYSEFPELTIFGFILLVFFHFVTIFPISNDYDDE